VCVDKLLSSEDVNGQDDFSERRMDVRIFDTWNNGFAKGYSTSSCGGTERNLGVPVSGTAPEFCRRRNETRQADAQESAAKDTVFHRNTIAGLGA